MVKTPLLVVLPMDLVSEWELELPISVPLELPSGKDGDRDHILEKVMENVVSKMESGFLWPEVKVAEQVALNKSVTLEVLVAEQVEEEPWLVPPGEPTLVVAEEVPETSEPSVRLLDSWTEPEVEKGLEQSTEMVILMDTQIRWEEPGEQPTVKPLEVV